MKRSKKKQTPQAAEARIKSFLDMIAPPVVKFNTDHFICGNTYRSVWALREYPTSTEEQAILSHLAEHSGRIDIRGSGRIGRRRQHDHLVSLKRFINSA